MPSFRDLAERIASLEDIPKTLPEVAAEAFNDRLGGGFVAESDPYGDGWSPLASSTVRRKGHDRILFESGDMFSDTKAVATGSTIEFEGPEYGPFHQGRSGRRPARPAVPNRSELPATWRQDIADSFTSAVDDALKK